VEHNEDKNKIILKRSELPGVDMSISDFTMAHTVRVVVSKVTETMYKVGSKTYIGTLDQLDDGEVFQVGSLGLFYKVIKRINSYTAQRYLYQIRRLDGNSTTATDLNAVKSGQKIKLTSRRTFKQMINYACSMREDKSDPCKEEPIYPGLCGDECTPAPPPSPEPEIVYTYNCVEGECRTYRCRIPSIVGSGRMFYIGCNKGQQFENLIATKSGYTIEICGVEGQTGTDIYIDATPISGQFSFEETTNVCGTFSECVKVEGKSGTYSTKELCENSCFQVSN
jgi:hypothetical protein